jgi:hypothetical protein
MPENTVKQQFGKEEAWSYLQLIASKAKSEIKVNYSVITM